ncbi:MAG: glutamyl-tRNA reductase [Planctomycetota bacterium]|nr:MAG: glutamyl-tRNA reductase [Planctomycetota bacterium]
MNYKVVFCTHQTAGLEIRERLAFPNEQTLRAAYRQLRERFRHTEFVILSTCNRVELYVAHQDEGSGPSLHQLAAFLSEFHGVPLDDFIDRLVELRDASAVRHLFQVVCSLDSMVLGEPQIVSQVKDAYRVALEAESCGPLTNALFQAAIRVSKRVRTETRLSEGRVSIASVAVGEFGRAIFDRFDDKHVLVIGAGEMAEETLRYLVSEGASRITIVNRTPQRAHELAARVGSAEIRGLDRLTDALRDADIVVSTTGASEPVITAELFRKVRRGREDRPVFLLDLGAPRDIEPQVAEIDENVFLFDIDDLRATCEANRRARSQEIQRALELIDEETEKFLHEVYHRATGPVIKQLRDQWHQVTREELQRLRRKLPELDDEQFAQIEQTVQRIVNKLLHPPLETLKTESREGPPHGLLEAIRRLFHIRD